MRSAPDLPLHSRAEELFSKTLTMRPGHEDARLGRAICRTYLSKGNEAIADATILIDARAANRSDAYYWRAWNHRPNQQVDLARADIDSARILRYNASILTLAGMIEHDQKDFLKAREDLTRAREMESTRQLAGFDAAIEEDSTQKSAADFNAAVNYGRAGDVPNATIYMKRAANDPERRVAVEDLRQVLGVPRW